MGKIAKDKKNEELTTANFSTETILKTEVKSPKKRRMKRITKNQVRK